MDALQALARLGNGRFPEELADAIAAVSEDVVETGRKGGVTVKIGIVPAANLGEPMALVAVEITTKRPGTAPKATYFYVLDGELSESDPRQMVLPVREVDTTTGEIKEVQHGQTVREVK